MDNKEYAALQLRASLCPSLETQWDSPTTFSHWPELHRAANELRETVSNCFTALAAIEHNKDLTPQARKRKRADLAQQTLSCLEQLPSLEKARVSIASITTKWERQIDSVLVHPKPEDASTALLMREIRDKFLTTSVELNRYGRERQSASLQAGDFWELRNGPMFRIGASN